MKKTFDVYKYFRYIRLKSEISREHLNCCCREAAIDLSYGTGHYVLLLRAFLFYYVHII